MQINVSIQLSEDETLNGTSDEIAANVLEAVSGDPDNDYCNVMIMNPPISGTAGTQPVPPMLPESSETPE